MANLTGDPPLSRSRSAFFFVASFLLQVFGSLVVALMGSSSRSAATTVGGAASDLRGG